ncbi:ATP phosphoribosyltransferase 2, chloroplastic isoform X2 [Sesbania bispinosa]|nr:ATP phosphoribosyltransferase 2, chloroplastic isoform X2 [Sesbania bispinosa]
MAGRGTTSVQGNEDLIIVHDALECGYCRLSFAPGPIFMKDNSLTLKHVTFSTADGALEAAPAVRDSIYIRESLGASEIGLLATVGVTMDKVTWEETMAHCSQDVGGG